MNEMILLGAGSSVEAGVPHSRELSVNIVEHFNSHKYIFNISLWELREVVNFVVGGLMFKSGYSNQNPFSVGVDVEDLFSAILLLAERDTLEIAPFVEAWDPRVDAFDQLEPRMDFSKVFKIFVDNLIDSIRIDQRGSVRLRGNAHSEATRELTEAMRAVQKKPGRGSIYRQTADAMILLLRSLITVEDIQKVKYLLPLISRAQNGRKIVISTLNYDNSIELASKSVGISCNTGINRWSETGTFDFSFPGLHLLKLHGSTDWIRINNVRTQERPMPHSTISGQDLESSQDGKIPSLYGSAPAVVFGHRNKLTADGPFLDLLREFQIELNKVSQLVVIGYSFRDDHINHYISTWLNTSSDHKLLVVDPGFNSSSVEYVQTLQGLRSRSKDQLTVLSKPASEGIAELFG